MRKELEQIYNKYNLTIFNDDKTEKTFTEVLSQIYMNFNKTELQSMMNDILSIELEGGGDPFENGSSIWGITKRNKIGFCYGN